MKKLDKVVRILIIKEGVFKKQSIQEYKNEQRAGTDEIPAGKRGSQ